MNKNKAVPDAAAHVEKAKRKSNLMYLGPTIVGVARRGTVFKSGILPKEAQDCIAELPIMERLFVEMDKMPEAVKELRKRPSALGMVYDQVEAHYAQKSKRRM